MSLRYIMALSVVAGVAAAAQPEISNLRARHVNGQTFLMWNEKDLEPDMKVAVYVHSERMTSDNLAKAQLLCGSLMPGSSCDFYDLQDAGYRRYQPLPQKGIRGAVAPWGGKAEPEIIPGRIEPNHGLFVRTARNSGKAFYAVAVTDKNRKRITEIRPAVSSLEDPVEEQSAARLVPILVAGRKYEGKPDTEKTPLNAVFGGAASEKNALKKMAEEGIPIEHYVVYGALEHGWREGIPFNFSVETIGNGSNRFYKLRLDPSDFAFMGSTDRGNICYGVNSHMVEPEKLTEGIVAPQSHRMILEMLEWVKEKYPIDPDRVWISVSSVPANGVFMLLLRHPEPFCAADIGALAPDFKLAYPFPHIAPVIWGPVDKVRTDEGLTVADVINLTEYLRKHPVCLPPMRFSNGRNDGWRPWQMCPPFYAALQDQGQPCWIFWDNKFHGNKTRHERFKEAYCLDLSKIFPRKKAFLGFVNGSANNNPGNGDKADGDLEGALNFYYRWSHVNDTKDKFSAEYGYERDGKTDGGKVDIVIHRIQNFQHGPGMKAKYCIRDGGNTVREGEVSADDFGRFRINEVPADRTYRLELAR